MVCGVSYLIAATIGKKIILRIIKKKETSIV
jgi:hypothetical protein